MLNLAKDFNQDLSFPDAVFESHLSSCLGDNSSAFLGQLSSMNPDWKISLAQIFSKTHVKPAMSRHVEFCTFAIFFAQPKLMMYRYIYLLTHKKNHTTIHNSIRRENWAWVSVWRSQTDWDYWDSLSCICWVRWPHFYISASARFSLSLFLKVMFFILTWRARIRFFFQTAFTLLNNTHSSFLEVVVLKFAWKPAKNMKTPFLPFAF